MLRAPYPGARGSNLLTPPGPATRTNDATGYLPVMLLPPAKEDISWAVALVKQRDADGNERRGAKEAGLPNTVFQKLDADHDSALTAAELASWADLPADHVWVVRLGDVNGDRPFVERESGPARLAAPDQLAMRQGKLHLVFRGDEGKLPVQAADSRERLQARFTTGDANGDGFVVAPEITDRPYGELRAVLAIADRKADGKLSQDELDGWLLLQEQVARGQVLWTLLDHGNGLFELLDADRDGSLSVPELRSARNRVKAAGCVSADGSFDRAALPHHLLAIASRGHPIDPFGAARHDGPVWFRAMDRNRDGYVSRKEFTGPAADFTRLDRNGDAFLDPKEAEQAKQP